MIELIELEDMKHIFLDYDKLNERTKIHTKQIQELQRELRELKK